MTDSESQRALGNIEGTLQSLTKSHDALITSNDLAHNAIKEDLSAHNDRMLTAIGDCNTSDESHRRLWQFVVLLATAASGAIGYLVAMHMEV